MRKSIYLLLVVVLACDSFDGDGIERQNLVTFSQIQTEFYTLPASSIVIDLKSLIKKSFISAYLRISENPIKGTLTKLDAFVYKYTPNYDFTEGQDQFIISAVLADGTTVNSKPMTVYMKSDEEGFPCGLYAVEDDIRIDPTSTIVIHVLKNDRICDVDEPVNVLVHLAPKFGEAVVVGDSIIYTPGPAFSKGEEFVYSVSTSNREEVSFGLVSFNKSKIEILEIPGIPGYDKNGLPLWYDKIFFIDQMTGFIAGGSTIQKTIDGGRHWIELNYPPEVNDGYFSFEEIYFLDKDHGFAAFSKCFDMLIVDCPGGWMKTSNGGESWERIGLRNEVNSITFTSPFTGYMSTTSQVYFGDNNYYRPVFKTVNGGETWDQVGEVYANGDGVKVNLRFATDNVGWAYLNNGIFSPPGESIFSTTDGGRTWKPFVTDVHVASFTHASDNVICASFAPDTHVSTPSAIVRSENGSPFLPVINSPYNILSQGFSPEGDFGVAVGVSGTNYSVDPASQILTISLSTDKGKSWVNLAEQLYGFPREISVPSANVAYILCHDKIIKYSP